MLWRYPGTVKTKTEMVLWKTASPFRSLTFWHQSFTFNRNKSPTWCKSFSVYYPDICLHLNVFRTFSRPSSGAHWLQWQPLVSLLTLLVPMCSIIIIKYIHSSNISTTFYKVSTGYMFRPSWAIIRPYIWTGSFDFSAFWDPKRL
jgi:hypothetical protein